MHTTRRALLALAAGAAALAPSAWAQTAPAILRSGARASLFVDQFGLSARGSVSIGSFAAFLASLRDPQATRPEAVENLRFFFANGGANAVLLDLDRLDVGAVTARLQGRGVPRDVDFISMPIAASKGEPAIAEAAALYQAGAVLAEDRRAMLLIDPPSFLTASASASDYVSRWRTPLAIDSPFAAFFAPRMVTMSPGASLGPLCASGVIAGLFTRTDAQLGCWHAPSGVINSAAPQTALNAATAQALVNAGVNPIRALPGGPRLLGSRTSSSDAQWRYIIVRRLASLIERDVKTLTPWTEAQLNTPAIWATARSSIETYLLGLFRDGALQGTRASEAFFVRIDPTTMIQSDIAAGRLIALIGFAPLRPAEFVMLRVAFATKV